MQNSVLSRRPHSPQPGQMFLESLSLEKGRVHEAFGRARHLFALLVMREMRGPVFWVRPAWEGARLNGPGMACFADPGRVVFVDAPRPLDLLWTLEEVLRSGEVPLVVGDLDGVPGLTPMRRLQLATETGGGRALGLVLTPEGRAPGAQSRWEMQPDHAAELTRWRLMRERGGGGAPRSWQVVPKGKGFTLL